MAVTAEELNVIIGANVQGLTKAIDRAERRIERFSKQSQKQMSSTARAFDAIGAASRRLGPIIATALGVQALKGVASTAIEIENMARVSGIAIDRFQELAFAARRFGVEQDKFADIIKDVNDKFGDYLATGAGPLVDFFENIAPKVGVTAEQFAKLSGPQALQLYVSSLEKAGVSQQQMTFYMEALASDATLLIDMFKNNGAAAEAFAEQLRSAGGILDEDMIRKTKEANAALDVMGKVVLSELTVALSQVMPFISDVASVIATIARNIGAAYSQVRQFFGGISHLGIEELNSELKKSDERVKQLEKTIIDLDENARKRAGGGLISKNAELEAIEAVIQKKEDELRLERERIEDLKAELAIRQKLANLPAPVDYIPGSVSSINSRLTTGQDSGKTTKETIEETKNAYEDLAESIGSSFDDAFDRIIEGTLSVKDAFKQMAISIIKEILKIQSQQFGGGSDVGLFTGIAKGLFNYFSPAAASARAASALPASFASGGMSMGTRPFIAGEHGRELVIPTGTSRILSAPQTKDILQQSGQPVTVVQHFNISTGVAQTVRAEIAGMMPAIQQQTVAAVANQKSRGGSRGNRL